MKARLTLEQAMQSITGVHCGKCGSDGGTIYPEPAPGTMYCPNCSPIWLQSFLEYRAKVVTHGNAS